jgi:hypothetical protein
MKMKKFIIAAVLLVFSVLANAGNTVDITCTFSIAASQKGLTEEKMIFQIVIDENTKKTYMVGNNGSSEVQQIPNDHGVSFVEITDSGNIMVTAISKTGEAVHSRNYLTYNGMIPSQSYGKCN